MGYATTVVERLSDDSKVYGVDIVVRGGAIRIDCEKEEDAVELVETIKRLQRGIYLR